MKNGHKINDTYDSEGVCTSKNVDGKIIQYYLNGNKIVMMKTEGDVVHFVYDADGELVSMKLNGENYYYIQNIQRDIVGLIDSSGVQVVSYQYDSWGRQINMKDISGKGIGNKNPFRYRGYYWDDEIEVYYLNSRYYDPLVGRFINTDSIEVLTMSQLNDNHKNLYAYCDNNPIRRKDEGGYFWNIVAGAVIGGLINLAFEAANQYKDKKLDVLNLIWAGVGGAISGGAAATGGGVICQSLVNGVLGLAGGVFEELRDDSKKSVFSVVIKLAGSTALGAFTGALGGKGIRAKGSPYRQVLDTRQEILRNSVERAMNDPSGLKSAITESLETGYTVTKKEVWDTTKNFALCSGCEAANCQRS